MEIRSHLRKLKKRRNVYIHNSPFYDDPCWHIHQEREKAFWEYELNRSTYDPRPVEHIKPSLEHWNIETVYFKNKSVLEIGSGPFGFFPGVALINPMHLPATLVVVDSLMDFYAKFKVAKLLPEQAIRIKAPGEDIPLPDNTFDIILTNNTIDHVSNCKDFLTEIRRLLKPDGCLLCSVHTLNDFAMILKPIIKKIDLNHPHHFRQKEVEHLFSECGFELKNKVSISLYKEESIPSEVNIIKKAIYIVGFFIMQTFYTVAIARGVNK